MPRMFRPFEAFIGWRYTWARRRNHFISFISLTSMFGVGLGVAALITVLSVMNGFEKELKDLHRRTGKTFVYITHSLEEAMVMSDRIAIMREGRIAQLGSADEIYSSPRSRFVAEFMGEVNLFDVEGDADGRLVSCDPALQINARTNGLEAGTRAVLMVRPEFIRFLADGESADCVVRGTVVNEFALGSRIQYELRSETGRTLTIEKLREDRFAGSPGDPIAIGWPLSCVHLIREPAER